MNIKPTSSLSISRFDNIFQLVREISAVDVARRFGVGFQKKRNRWVAHCPFHEDRTPSFFEHRNRFHCFGCGWSGDAVDLIAELLGLKPLEAAREIAGAFGLVTENVFAFQRDALLKYQRQRQEAAEKKAREKAEEERIISDFQILFRAAGRLVAQIRTLEDLDRYGWIYQHLGNLEEVAAALFSADRGTRQAALAEARRWLP